MVSEISTILSASRLNEMQILSNLYKLRLKIAKKMSEVTIGSLVPSASILETDFLYLFKLIFELYVYCINDVLYF